MYNVYNQAFIQAVLQMSVLNKDWDFECCEILVRSQGAASSTTGSWKNLGGSSGRKVPERNWPFFTSGEQVNPNSLKI